MKDIEGDETDAFDVTLEGPLEYALGAPAIFLTF